MTDEIALQPATAQDAEKIKNLVIAAHINPTGLDWRRFTVAVTLEDLVVGCVQIKPHRDGSQELASLVVDPEYQGQGIARLLMECQIRQYEGVLHLMCRASLGDFYEKFGFVGIDPSEMPPYFRRISRLASLAEILRKDDETLLIMRREANV